MIVHIMNFQTNSGSEIIKIIRGHFSEILDSKHSWSQEELIEGLEIARE